MNTKNFANRLGLTGKSLGLVLSFAGFVGTAAAQSPVVVTNTPAQPVPVSGYVYAMTQPQLAPVQVDLHLNFASDVAPKAAFTIPAGQRLNVQHVSTRCQVNMGGENDFTLRLGTGVDRAFHWYRLTAKTFAYPSFGLTWVGFAGEPIQGIFEAGPIWADGIRTQNTGVLTHCDIAILGYYTQAPQQISIN
jgi:hypothetical protein